MSADDDLPAPVERKPRMTPAHEERLAPVDAKSRESYEAAEAALATKGVAGDKLDELVALLDDAGGVPQAMLEITDSTVHRLAEHLLPGKKPNAG
jgi:hypothetical protein